MFALSPDLVRVVYRLLDSKDALAFAQTSSVYFRLFQQSICENAKWLYKAAAHYARHGYTSTFANMIAMAGDRFDPLTAHQRAARRAVKYGHIDILRILLAHSKTMPELNGNSLIRIAAKYGSVEIVQLLLNDSRVDPSDAVQYAITIACVLGRLEVVQLLLDDPRVDPRGRKQRPLKHAIDKGHVEVVKLLLADARISVADVDNLAIRAAAYRGNVEIVKMILERPEVDPTAQNNDALCIAVKYGFAEVVRLLLANKRVSPYARNSYPLRIASANGYTKIVLILLEDPTFDAGTYMYTAIHRAVEGNHIDIVELLMSRVFINENDEEIREMMRWIMDSNNADVVKLFIKYWGQTVSNISVFRVRSIAKHNFAITLRVLLDSGVFDPTIHHNHLLFCAREYAQHEIIDMLLRDPRVISEKNLAAIEKQTRARVKK